jgi:predicted dehydrogenase
LGVYCINAARYLFRDEPTSVLAVTSNSNPKKFHGVDEAATAILRFPNDRVAQFTVSQGAADSSEYRIVGTKGDIHAQPAYEYVGEIAYELTVGGKTKKFNTTKHDQVAAELLYFSNCILIDKNPEPSGREGLADVRIVRAIYRSADSGRAIELKPLMKAQRPNSSQTISRPGHQEPELVHASPPSQS